VGVKVLGVIDSHGIVVNFIRGKGGAYEGCCLKGPPIGSGRGFGVISEAIGVTPR
jgi:hypothetical protein